MATLLDTRPLTIRSSEEPNHSAADQLLSRIAALAPMIAEHTLQIEHGRRLPNDIVNGLKSARVFSALVPRRYGGLELDGAGSLRVISTLAKIEGAVGWNAFIGMAGSLIPFMTTPSLCEQILDEGRDHILAGSGRPNGKAERVDGGWKVTGSWPFASGCQHAEWMMGTCTMMQAGSPIPASEGEGPMMRSFLMPAEHWEICDTWHTFGLRGTGSHDVAVRDLFVPDDNFFEFPFGTSFAADPVFGRFPELLLLCHAAWAVGTADGAVQDLIDLATSGIKQQRMIAPLAETERFKEGLARLAAELAAARALLEMQTRIWQDMKGNSARDMSRFAKFQAPATWIAAACLRVAEGSFELAGSRAIYESSTLQRRLRDLRVGTTHATVHPRNYVSAGAAMLS